MIKSLFLGPLILVATISILSTSFADSPPMAEGVIKKIVIESGKVTIKHGEIESLEMPPMSMVFNVKDPSVLEAFKKGDKIKFIALDEDGKFWATDIQADTSE